MDAAGVSEIDCFAEMIGDFTACRIPCGSAPDKGIDIDTTIARSRHRRANDSHAAPDNFRDPNIRSLPKTLLW